MFDASGVDPPFRKVYLPGVQETTLFFSVVVPAASRRSALPLVSADRKLNLIP